MLTAPHLYLIMCMNNHRIPDWLIEIAHHATRVPFLKQVLKPLYYPLKERIAKSQLAHFHNNALELLTCFDKCMIDNGIEYSLLFGSLLGAIREHGFIAHDVDIDVALFIEDRTASLYDALASVGFSRLRSFAIGDGILGCEDTFVFKNTGVTLDVFYVCPAIDQYPYVCCWNLIGDCSTPRESMRKYGGVIPRRIELPFTHEYLRTAFESITVSVFANAHQISEFCYGPDYMTPDPNYVVPTEHRYVWKEQRASFIEYNT